MSSYGPSLTRRGFGGTIGLVAAGLLAGCVARSSPGPATSSGPAAVDPLESVAEEHSSLRDAYVEAIAARPSLAARLSPLLSDVQQQVAALAAALAQAAPTASAHTTSEATSTGAAPPPDPQSLIDALIEREQAAQKALVAMIGAVSADRAPLVGSIAASCACHVVVLGG